MDKTAKAPKRTTGRKSSSKAAATSRIPKTMTLHEVTRTLGKLQAEILLLKKKNLLLEKLIKEAGDPDALSRQLWENPSVRAAIEEDRADPTSGFNTPPAKAIARINRILS